MSELVHGWGLEWYLTLCASSHVSEAADELGLGQSTLSRRLARLERDVGAALFDRVGTRLRLNPRGAALRAHLERAHAEVAAGVGEVRRLADPQRGTIRFDFLHSLSTWLMPSLVRGFLDGRPGIDFALHQGPGIELSERVAAGASDLAITTPRPRDPELEFVLVLGERQGLAVPAGHRLAGRTSVHLSEAADEPFATLLRGYGTRITFDALCAEAGFTPRIVFEAGEILTAGGLVSAGLAVSVVPLDNAELRPADADLIPLRTSIRREIGVVRHRRAAPNPPVDAFWEFVSAEASTLLAPAPGPTTGQGEGQGPGARRRAYSGAMSTEKKEAKSKASTSGSGLEERIVLNRIYDARKGEGEPKGASNFLVDRLWPRGVAKDSVELAGWPKELTPSTELRKKFHHDAADWDDFRAEYESELDQRLADGELDDALDDIRSALGGKGGARKGKGGKGIVALLFAGKDTEHTHAEVLREWLVRELG